MPPLLLLGAEIGCAAVLLARMRCTARLRRLNGVAAAGTLSDVDVRGALVRSVPINDPLGTGAVQLPKNVPNTVYVSVVSMGGRSCSAPNDEWSLGNDSKLVVKRLHAK